jgi:RNA polymerase sigma-70 factor, ECF subfamily
MQTLTENKCVQSDAALVARARIGDREAFGELIKRHYKTCVRIASFTLRDWGDAQDEVQVACWKAFRHLDQYHGDSEFLPWLIRIVVNQCLMLIRVRRRKRFIYLDCAGTPNGTRPLELPSLFSGPERQASDHEMLEVVQREIRRIPRLLRTVIVLRDIEELPMSDVAQRLGITVPAAKSRLLRARSELKERVMRHCGKSGHPTSSPRGLPSKAGRPLAWLD